jgi:hypothetical protein
MALAMEQSHLSGLGDILAITSQLATLDPTFLDSLNPRTLLPHFARAKGLPTILLRTEKQLAELDAARAEAAQQQQAIAATEAVRNLGGARETMDAAQQLSPQQ